MESQLEKYIRSLALPVGTQLAEVTIRGIIGVGTAGIVYDAYDSTLQRELAVKEFLPVKLAKRNADLSVEPANKDCVDDFNAQLRIFTDSGIQLSPIKHKNIVQLFKVEQHNNTSYLLMEKVEGPLLSSRIGADNFIQPSIITEWADQILDALRYLHDNGMKHLALEPSNVIINPRHGPVLIDFGGPSISGNQYELKDNPYRAIELTSDSSLQVADYSDIYSAGALLSHIVTGTAPISATSRAVAKSDPQPHLANDAELKKSFSNNFLQSIDNALAIKPQSRYQSVSEWQYFISEKNLQKSKIRTVVSRSIYATIFVGLAIWLFFGRAFFAEKALWDSLESNQPCRATEYLSEYQNGRYVSEAETRMQLCQTKRNAEEAREKQQREKAVNNLVGEMVRVNTGCFQMGSPAAERSRSENERQHQVCIQKPFMIAKFEVSINLFNEFVKRRGYKTDAERNKNKEGCWALDPNDIEDPWDYKPWASWNNPYRGHKVIGSYPVTCVSPNDAETFITWINSISHLKFRLPTEAEWEFAARGQSNSSRPWGEDTNSTCNYANVADITNDPAITGDSSNRSPWPSYHGCEDGSVYASPVGKYRPNHLGIHDMIGNAWEITCSGYSGSYGGLETDCAPRGNDDPRADRGGGWESNPANTRSASRGSLGYFDRGSNIGFRLVRDILIAEE